MNQNLPEHRHIGTERAVLPVLVLYHIELKNSTTYQTFVASSREGGLDPDLIAVYDNSETPHVSPADKPHLLAYEHDPANSGLAAAYNWATDLARAQGFSWLLLLDQDSRLHIDFLPTLLRTAALHGSDNSVAAIVPIVTDKGVTISPKRVRFGRLVLLPKPTPTVADYEVTAINSGAALKTSFVTSIGGFDPVYRLDCLDHWLFRQIYANGKKAVISGSILDHNLSVSNYRTQVSVARYRSILFAETRFVTTQKSWLELPVYLTRLMLRAMKQLLIYRRPNLTAITLATAVVIIMRTITKQRHSDFPPN